jgi:GNAT superfamily N-acetyltransferase
MEIKTDRFRDFFEVPFSIYKDSNYVSPFKDDLKRFLNKKNPTFAGKNNYELFTVYIEGKCVGRICAHIHEKYNDHYKSQTGFFGFFDCIDDQAVANSLLDSACKWLKDKGMKEVWGNFNLTTQQPFGVMTEGFENKPYMEMLYSSKYIADLLKARGFSPDFPVTTFEINLEEAVDNNLSSAKVMEIFDNKDFEIKKVSKKNFKTQMAECCKLLNISFANNPLFVPISTDEFWFQAKEMTYILDEEITQFIYHKGEVAGVVVCVPDLNPILKKFHSRLGIGLIFKLLRLKKNKDRALLVFASVDPKFHSKGLGAAMFIRCIEMLRKNGYKSLGITWVSDTNKASLASINKLKHKKVHRLHIFKKEL